MSTRLTDPDGPTGPRPARESGAAARGQSTPRTRRRARSLDPYRALLACCQDAALLARVPSLDVVESNAAAASMLEEVGERAGSAPIDALLPALRGWIRSESESASSEAREARFDTTLEGRAGRIPVNATLVLHRHRGNPYATIVLRDMRPTLYAKQRIGEAHARVQSLVDALPAVVFEIDHEGVIVFMNREARELTGHRLDSGPVRRTLFDFVVLEEQARAKELWQNRVGNPHGIRLHVLRADGTATPVLLQTAPLTRDGVHVSSLVVLIDLAEQAEIEQRVATSQKLESLGRLASGIAHDFNNALGGIQAVCELVLMDLEEDSNARNDVQTILEATLRAGQLTRELLLFGSQQQVGQDAVDLGQITLQVERLLARVLGEDVEVEVELPGGLWTVEAEPTQVEQILMNLALNARDAMPRGGTLTIAMRNARLDDAQAQAFLGNIPPGDYGLIEVSDEGVGIDPAHIGRLFEPYFTTKGPGKGTGLGLATVYGIVKSSRGGVQVESTRGVGTTFRVVLPRSAATSERREIESERPERPGSESVLVVEDYGPIRNTVCRALSSRGYVVFAAEHPNAALALTARRPTGFDLLLTDVVLPTMSGPSLAACVVERFPSTRVLYMSGYNEEDTLARGLKAGTVHFLQKPFSIATLLKKVREVLSGP